MPMSAWIVPPFDDWSSSMNWTVPLALAVSVVSTAVGQEPVARAGAGRPAAADSLAPVVDSAERATLIEQVAAALERGYVFPDTARLIIQALRERFRRGEYDRLVDPTALADSLTAHLRAVSHDEHLRVRVRGGGAGPMRAPGNPGISANGPGGVGEVRRLDGNIGYLLLNGFPDVSRMGPALAAAMEQLASTDALLIDLRRNGGGSPASVMQLAGYFFDRPTLMARFYSRPDDVTTEQWSAEVSGPKYGGKPLYMLTSNRTFSAAEAAAYHLQAFGRAVVVGETTRGGAHPSRRADLTLRFDMVVPGARTMSIPTGTDWERVGVVPNIAVSAERALVAAQLAALRSLPRTAERDRVIAELERGGA
ncbi:MAG: S41 family peptidase [Gemmatimonadales bacterium]|nr:S41 family peptidase [Gemmatimonadales bacterium]